ncbi:hypothetical protein GCM10009765_29490 [Fodinicola feengrottensis]|uniref:Uncharacterized protein n=1 Tax=Fodinicola feengrottensis TaxID=435914 RepID=A0ABP4SU66_9ACTN
MDEGRDPSVGCRCRAVRRHALVLGQYGPQLGQAGVTAGAHDPHLGTGEPLAYVQETGQRRQVYAATYGRPPDPPATAALLAALAATKPDGDGGSAEDGPRRSVR